VQSFVNRLMIAVAIVGLLLGAVLALRFKVFVLAPTVLVMLSIIGIGGILRSETVWWMASAILVGATSLQFGYLGGSVLHFIGGRREKNKSESTHSCSPK
jgi:xanthosine utilization system XapX-like protein